MPCGESSSSCSSSFYSYSLVVIDTGEVFLLSICGMGIVTGLALVVGDCCCYEAAPELVKVDCSFVKAAMLV